MDRHGLKSYLQPYSGCDILEEIMKVNDRLQVELVIVEPDIVDTETECILLKIRPVAVDQVGKGKSGGKAEVKALLCKTNCFKALIEGQREKIVPVRMKSSLCVLEEKLRFPAEAEGILIGGLPMEHIPGSVEGHINTQANGGGKIVLIVLDIGGCEDVEYIPAGGYRPHVIGFGNSRGLFQV